MSSKIKRIKRMVRSPNDVRFPDIDTVLKDFGYENRNNGTSHHVYSKPGHRNIITIPKRQPVKKIYVKRVIELLGLEEWLDENS